MSQFHKREVEVLESLRSDRFKPEFYGIIIEGGEVRIFMELIGESAIRNAFVFVLAFQKSGFADFKMSDKELIL